MNGSACSLASDVRYCSYYVDNTNVPVSCSCQSGAWVCSHNDPLLGRDLAMPLIQDLASSD
jgi:hypothetical protein